MRGTRPHTPRAPRSVPSCADALMSLATCASCLESDLESPLKLAESVTVSSASATSSERRSAVSVSPAMVSPNVEAAAGA